MKWKGYIHCKYDNCFEDWKIFDSKQEAIDWVNRNVYDCSDGQLIEVRNGWERIVSRCGEDGFITPEEAIKEKIDDDLKAENEKMRKALEHYADRSNWGSYTHPWQNGYQPDGDGFWIAEQALNGDHE